MTNINDKTISNKLTSHSGSKGIVRTKDIYDGVQCTHHHGEVMSSVGTTIDGTQQCEVGTIKPPVHGRMMDYPTIEKYLESALD